MKVALSLVRFQSHIGNQIMLFKGLLHSLHPIQDHFSGALGLACGGKKKQNCE